jgi:ribosomal protein S18 acetylase RimI-like enzyme
MSGVKLESLAKVDLGLLAPLMDQEEQSWLSELDWDYRPIRKIISSFMNQRLLPGYVASTKGRARGYTYFLIQHSKGIIGTLYASPPDPQSIAERVLAEAVGWLQNSQSISRIEAQLFPLSQLVLTPLFERHGFRHYPRHYLELDMSAIDWSRSPDCSVAIIPWESSRISQAAQVTYGSYANELDAEICEDYASPGGCENYLRSLVENPGCGIFLPEASYIGIDSQGISCGFITTSRISPSAAMIPQISIHPSHQGRRLGTALIYRALKSIATLGYSVVRLTVTAQNRRAYEWYQRLGFKSRRTFGAYIWQRS